MAKGTPMEFKQLETFKLLTEELSFTRTAERLNYAQSSVTAQIQSLERELGVPLFERLGKRVYLTEAGTRLQTYAERLLDLAHEAHLAVPGSQQPSGVLTIGAAESLYTYRLAPILMIFRSQYPNVELMFRTGECTQLRHQVLHGELDLAFTLEQACHIPGLLVEVLMPESIRIVTSPNHPLAQYHAVRPSDLERQTILVPEPGSYRTLFEQSLASAGIQYFKAEFASIEAIKQCVMAGLGIAALPDMAVRKELRRGLLQALPWVGSPFPIVTQLCRHQRKWLSPALKAFIDMTKDEMLRQDTHGELPPINQSSRNYG